MNRTKIEWVLNPDNKTLGWIWNPLTGCLNHIDGMCRGGNFPCYAYRLANTRLKERYLENKDLAPIEGGASPSWSMFKNPFYPRFWPERMSGQLSSRKPKGIFVCDMSDLFGIGVPENWTWQVLQLIKAYPQHRFYLLTKQPQRLPEFSPFPDNVYLGVTVCNDQMLDVAVDKLEDIQGKVKFISFEPLLERLTLSLDYAFYYSGISWLIIGAQTKPYKPPKIEWVREIVEAADKVGVAVFLKDNLKPLIKAQGMINGKWAAKEWVMCEYPVLRQEMPR